VVEIEHKLGQAIYTLFVHSYPYNEILSGGNMGIYMGQFFSGAGNLMADRVHTPEIAFYRYVVEHPECCSEYYEIAKRNERVWPSVTKLLNDAIRRGNNG
jgi:hypothetical protein